MKTSTTPSSQMEHQERSLFLIVAVVGYIITFSGSVKVGENDRVARLLIRIGCGVIYLLEGFFKAEIYRRFSPNVRNAVYFSSQLTVS